MGHCINAFLGYSGRISLLAKKWLRDPIQLSQGLSILFLEETLFDDISRFNNNRNKIALEGFGYFNSYSSILSLLAEYSQNDKLAYFETEYFGGTGGQVAIIYENGKQKFPIIHTVDPNAMNIWTPDDERAINIILKEFNVCRLEGQDEFDSIGLGNYRKML